MGKSREEALLKRQQDALDELAHLMEDCNNRLTLEALNIGERYAEGRLYICLKLRARNGGEEFILIAGTDRAWRRDISLGVHVLPIAISNYQDNGVAASFLPSIGSPSLYAVVPHPRSEGCRHQGRMVLIPFVEGVKRPQESIPSFVWLGCANQFFCLWGQLFLFSKGFLEFLGRGPKGKHNPVGCRMAQECDCASGLVEWRAKSMENGADIYAQFLREFLPYPKVPDLLSAVRIDLGEHFIGVRFVEGADLGVKVVDVGFGPFDLGERRKKRRGRLILHDPSSFA
jgi:hypothetical protein